MLLCGTLLEILITYLLLEKLASYKCDNCIILSEWIHIIIHKHNFITKANSLSGSIKANLSLKTCSQLP